MNHLTVFNHSAQIYVLTPLEDHSVLKHGPFRKHGLFKECKKLLQEYEKGSMFCGGKFNLILYLIKIYL